MSTVHFAGLDVRIDNRLRQRCAWCGETLIDYDLDRIQVPDGQDGTPSTWPVPSLVEVDGGMSYVVAYEPDGALPDNTCAANEARP